MGAFGRKLRNSNIGYTFWCPGCQMHHGVRTDGREPNRNWTFNGNGDAPTFHPSVVVRTIRQDLSSEEWDRYEALSHTVPYEELLEHPDFRLRCHSFVTDGRIQFLSDSTHHLAGQTVELPDMPQPATD